MAGAELRDDAAVRPAKVLGKLYMRRCQRLDSKFITTDYTRGRSNLSGKRKLQLFVIGCQDACKFTVQLFNCHNLNML
jgi:hypothetical protein